MLADAFKPMITFMIIGFISIPFGIWKIVEIIIWIVKHVHIGVS